MFGFWKGPHVEQRVRVFSYCSEHTPTKFTCNLSRSVQQQSSTGLSNFTVYSNVRPYKFLNCVVPRRPWDITCVMIIFLKLRLRFHQWFRPGYLLFLKCTGPFRCNLFENIYNCGLKWPSKLGADINVTVWRCILFATIYGCSLKWPANRDRSRPPISKVDSR